MSILRAGTEANPFKSVSLSKLALILILLISFLLTFACAEPQELKKEHRTSTPHSTSSPQPCKAQLERLAAVSPSNPRRYTEWLHRRYENGTRSSSGTLSTHTSFNPSSSLEHSNKHEAIELIERKAKRGLAYVVYMRFARRTDGVKASRAVLGRARKDWWAPWGVCEASGAYRLPSSVIFY